MKSTAFAGLAAGVIAGRPAYGRGYERQQPVRGYGA